nr:glutamate receptor ionotropic, kainate 4-like [Lepeophtheirus salmonis]
MTSRSKKETALAYILLNIWASFMNQGITHPQRSSLRILRAAWFLFSLCIVSSYAGSLFSWLTVPKYEPSIDSLEQLLNSSLKIITLKGTYHNDIFKNSEDPLFQRTYTRIYRGPTLCTSFSECFHFINNNIG